MGYSVGSASKHRASRFGRQEESGRMARSWLILSALVAGLALGAGWTRLGLGGISDAVALADSVGGVWLDGLRMTIGSLVVSLLITGIAKTADSARGDSVALRSVVTFLDGTSRVGGQRVY